MAKGIHCIIDNIIGKILQAVGIVSLSCIFCLYFKNSSLESQASELVIWEFAHLISEDGYLPFGQLKPSATAPCVALISDILVTIHGRYTAALESMLLRFLPITIPVRPGG